MKIYLRKILKHDLTHQVSVTQDIVDNFFDDVESFRLKNKTNERVGNVTLLRATDPRFGGDFKSLMCEEGGISSINSAVPSTYEPYINDIIIIYKNTDVYVLEYVSKSNPNYRALDKLFKEGDRHTIINIDDLPMQYEEPSKLDDTPLNDEYEKNIILYGPPGTGKTYNTVVKAMEILDPQTIKWKDANNKYLGVTNYEELKQKFDEYKKLGQIEFVTFHQSYSYEEFVEGIKPDLESDDIRYERLDGVFKKICERAETKFSDNFEEIYEKFLDEISCTEGLFKLTTRKYKKEFGLDINSNNNLNIYMGSDFHKQGTLTKENIQRHFLQTRIQSDWSGYYDGIIDYLKEKYSLEKQDRKAQPYVLIIDEINRGNISKIFGELITLIENDKRENLIVKLPYSQEDFTVPKNLYIIGTMNTSDRSIASIDIALRRRFTFEEIMPNKDLVPNIEVYGIRLPKLFETLNNRISVLLDRDHQIGHSYFIKLKDDENKENNFEKIWFDKVMPLLNEYFYGDWEKLRAILGKPLKDGKSFIKEIDNVKFADAYDCDIEERLDFVQKDKINFKDAINNAFQYTES